MFPVNIFSKVRTGINERVLNAEPGLYLYIAFPIAFAFLVTFVCARILSHVDPDAYIPWSGIHVHHFAYGFFILAAAGYLALVFSSPRAKFFIALLHGIGLGLAFDEFGIWLHLDDSDPARFSYDGFLIVVAGFFLLVTIRPGLKMAKKLLNLM